MKVQLLGSKRARSLVAATGIAAAIMLNGLGGGNAGAQNAPADAKTVCAVAPSTGTEGPFSSANGADTASNPESAKPNDSQPVTLPAGDAKPGEAGQASVGGESGGMSTGASGEASTPELSVTQAVPGEPVGTFEDCGVATGGSAVSAGQSITVDVCVSTSETTIQSGTAGFETAPSQSGDLKPGTGAGGTAAGGTSDAAPIEGSVTTFPDDRNPVVSGQVAVVTGGVASSSSSTCVSVSVTDGVPSITVPGDPGVPAESGGATTSDSGKSANGEAYPTQPNAGTTQAPDPNSTPAPGR